MRVGDLPKRALNLQGKTFGFLTVLNYAGDLPPRNAVLWHCRCHCGALVVRQAQNLTRMVKQGYAPSCPDCRIRRAGEAKQTHGMSKHPAFMAWCSLRARCRDPNRLEWKHYGGRGITVCDEWEQSFETFWSDMGPTWREGLEIDRIDNMGNYEPGNCHWVVRRQNANNKRVNLPVNMKRLEKRTGIKLRTLYTRWYRGQSMTSETPDPDRASWSWAMTAHS